jgi:putative transposase
MISECHACCASNSITQRISPDASARSTSSPFVANDADQINFAAKPAQKVLFDTARIYHEQGRWNLNLLSLMPDHLHALIGVDGRDSLSQLIRDYKRITAKMAGIRWQRNFFDHRLRHDESLAEKFAYVCQNPVRAGLIGDERDWPYISIPGRGGLTPSW